MFLAAPIVYAFWIIVLLIIFFAGLTYALLSILKEFIVVKLFPDDTEIPKIPILRKNLSKSIK